MVDSVKIEVEKDDVYEKSDSEKLNFLIDIAFSNHKQLSTQGKTLFGNGDPKAGLCYRVESQGTLLKWLIGILSAVGLAGLAAIGAFITK